MFPNDELKVQCPMYSEKAFGCLSVDIVLTTFFFLESVKDGFTNVFITETSQRYPRFSTYLVTMGEVKGWNKNDKN